MTVSSELCSARRSWTGAETSIASGFTAGAADDVVVQSEVSGVATLLTRGLHYTSSLSLEGELLVMPLALPATPATLVITRQTPAIQPMDLSNAALLDIEALEYELDAGARRDAELRAGLAALEPMGDRIDALEASIEGLTPEGVLLLASAPEVIAGTVDTKAISPATLEAWRAAQPPTIKARHPEAYGGYGNGTTDDMAAIMTALTECGGVIEGKAGSIYRTNGRINAPDTFVWNLNSATWKPVYAGEVAHSTYATPLYSALAAVGLAWTGTYLAGGRAFTCAATPTDLAVGDTVYFTGTTLNARWPVTFRRVVSVTGTVVGLDEVIPYAIGGTVTMRKIAFRGRFEMRGGAIDATGVTHGAQRIFALMRLMSYQRVLIEDMTFDNVNFGAVDAGTSDYLLYADYCYDVATRIIRMPNAVRSGSTMAVFRAKNWSAETIDWSGSGFGIAPVNCDDFLISDTTAAGRFVSGADTVSVRGIRPIGCLSGTIRKATILDYDSAVKLEDCANITVDDLTATRCNTGFNLSDQNPDPRSGGHILSNFRAVDCYGNAISLGTSAATDGYWRPVLISNALIDGAGAGAAAEPIIQRGGTALYSNVVIRDWASGYAPLRTLTAASGEKAKGALENVHALASTPTGRLGIDIDPSHTGLLIGPNVSCNAPAGPFVQRPPVPASLVSPGLMELGRLNSANLNSTADQAIPITLPAGYSRFRLLFIWAVWRSGANPVNTAAGGIYTAAAKGGTAIVAATQAYTSLAGANTAFQLVTVAAAINSVMTGSTLYLSLTTPQGAAAVADIIMLGTPID